MVQSFFSEGYSFFTKLPSILKENSFMRRRKFAIEWSKQQFIDDRARPFRWPPRCGGCVHVTDIVRRSDFHENVTHEHPVVQIIMLIAIMEIKQSAPLITGSQNCDTG